MKDREQAYPQSELEGWDTRHLWHPFTQMQDYCNEIPLIIDRGDGSFLFDIYGNRYLDGVSSLWVNLHGHRREEIDRAIIGQVQRVSHSTLLGISHAPAIILAKKMAEIAPPGLSRIFYSDNGSTAVEIALKIAFQYWQQKKSPRKRKHTFISLDYAYHGDTLGAVSVGGIDVFHQIYRPLLHSTFRIPSPYCYRCSLDKSYPSCGLDCLNRAEDVIKRHHEEVAALIIEPLVQGAAGMLVAPDGYLKEIRRLCTAYDLLLIADEVAVGFGRTGTMFACEQEGVAPDLLCAAKGITGGYLPLAVTLATEEIYGAFLGEYRELKTFFHGHSYTGNPLACSAALASLSIFDRDRTLDVLQPKIAFLREKLRRFTGLTHVGEVRQKGFMVGIELVADRESRQPFAPEKKTGIRVIQEARRHGLIIRPLGDVIVLMPPLSIALEHLEEVTTIVFNAIKHITEVKEQ